MFQTDALNDFFDRFSGDKRAHMMAVYIEGFNRHVSRGETAVENGDVKDLAASAHDVKSLALTLGCGNMAAVAIDIEGDVLTGDNAAALAKAPGLIEKMRAVILALESMLAQDDPA